MFNIILVVVGTFLLISLVCVFVVEHYIKPPVTLIKSDTVLSASDTDKYEIPILMTIDAQSDLDVVENIIYEASYNIIASKDSKPLIKYRVFDETQIEFIVLLKVKASSNSYMLKQEFLRLVKKLFSKNKIKVLFPNNANLYLIS